MLWVIVPGDFGRIDQVIPERIDQSKKKQNYLYHIIYQFIGVVNLDRNELTLNSETRWSNLTKSSFTRLIKYRHCECGTCPSFEKRNVFFSFWEVNGYSHQVISVGRRDIITENTLRVFFFCLSQGFNGVHRASLTSYTRHTQKLCQIFIRVKCY